MNLIFIGFGIFIVSVVVIELIAYAARNFKSVRRAKVKKRLKRYVYETPDEPGSEILRKHIYSKSAFFNWFLSGIPGIGRLERLTIQANSAQTPGFFLLLSLLLAVAGTLVPFLYHIKLYFAVPIGLFVAMLPLLQLKQLKQKRLDKFQAQLPEGLELIARAMKAGHAFSGGMQLAAEEFADPLGPEFEYTLDEINFGVSVPDALHNLARRIDCPELKYFVVAVILQRESGGNLAELLESLAHLIREKFKFQGKVRTLSAEGKLSAVVLCVLPFFIVAYLRVTNPQYLDLLINEPVGKMMIAGASLMMAAGIVVMRRMVQINI